MTDGESRDGQGPDRGGDSARDPGGPPDGSPLEGDAAGTLRDNEEPPVSGAELARQALEQAKADARRRGAPPGGVRGRDSAGSPAPRPHRSGSPRDPLPLRGAIDELVTDRGWELPAAVASIFARWPEIVGAELAAHARPQSFADGELLVVADSAAWATQVRLLSGSLLRRLREELGEQSVQRVRVRGPARAPGESGSGGGGISRLRGS